jgi:hypothetical protein
MHKEDSVYVASSNQFRPAISHDMVVFEDYGNDDIRDIRLSKIGTRSEPETINKNDLDKANPDIDGNGLCINSWMMERMTGTFIFTIMRQKRPDK